MESVEYGLTQRILAILAQDPEAVRRNFSAYPLYPLYAEGWYTPLAFAVIRGSTETVRLLIDHGADAAIRSPDDRSLHEIAQERGHELIAGLLMEPVHQK